MKGFQYMKNALRHRWPISISIMASAIAVAVVIVLYSEGLLSGDTGPAYSITRGSMTVELSGATINSDSLELLYTFRNSDPNRTVHQLGIPHIAASDGALGKASAGRKSASQSEVKITWDAEAPAQGENLAINMGSFVVSEPLITGQTSIPIGSQFADAEFTDDELTSVSVQANLSVGDGQYSINELVIDRTSTEDSFWLKVTPTNRSARAVELGAGGPAQVTLTDESGRSYEWIGTSTRWTTSTNSREVAWQHWVFDGMPDSAASSLAVNLRGGGKVSGPFVFRNVQLDSLSDPVAGGLSQGATGNAND